MSDPIQNGTIRVTDDVKRVYYDGYWIKAYDAPADSLSAKRRLIEALTRRLFNHVEHGINIPGKRLKEAREAFEQETDPERRRVKGAMLAGALFNRATDIFTRLVDLQEEGVDVEYDSTLMGECGQCLQDALALGKMVMHRSGDEGIDELWGEPFRAFSIPIEAFYESRYLKIAQTLRDIDRIAAVMTTHLAANPLFRGIESEIHKFAEAAKAKCETLRTDAQIFDIWTDFVVASEHLMAFTPHLSAAPTSTLMQLASDGKQLLIQGKDLVSYIARARVPMPKSTREYIEHCEHYAETVRERLLGHHSV
ncbi:MAG: hypothetical protein RBT55_06255 [Rhodocyclaceae bacterium]|jgi:hypothetical protein|nr:hypothetical protein [Rhodocyclaceae bacterium]